MIAALLTGAGRSSISGTMTSGHAGVGPARSPQHVAVDGPLDLDRYPTLPFMRRAWVLRASITAYDAAYVALAETLDCDLVTADRRLHQAHGPRCSVRLVA